MNKLYIYVNPNDIRTCYKPPSIDMMNNLNWKCLTYEDNNIDFVKYFIDNNIKIVLMFFNYDNFLYKYIKVITENKIKFLIYKSDLHYLPRKTCDRVVNFDNFINDIENIYICANYWYCYQTFHNINKNRIIKYPIFFDDTLIINYNSNPLNFVLLSGTCTSEYPARKKIKSLANNGNQYIHILKNCNNVIGHDFIKYLNKYLCCFTCCSNMYTPYIVTKFFEIPSTGSLLLAYDEFVKEPLKELGFIDGENYISCTINNIDEKVNYITNPNNRNEIDKIRKNGYDFVWKFHKQSDRMKFIDNIVDKL
jgi:hypothetical protein